jgi:hypothetical protein
MSGAENGDKNFDIGFSARATLEAKISTEIPSDSSGRLLDTITDMFRPFAERRGLKADLIRLQREEVLIEIAEKAYRRLEIEKADPSPIPNKFLIPFLEKASLEDDDSFLIDRWADLLVSSSMEPASAHPRFVQILSELGAAEAKLLRDIALHKAENTNNLKRQLEADAWVYLPDNTIRIFSSLVKLASHEPEEMYKELMCKILCLMSGPGISISDVRMIGKRDASSFFSVDMPDAQTYPGNIPQEGKKLLIDILCSLHLLNHYYVEVPREGFERIEISYVLVTPLGLEFLRKCDRDLDHQILNPPTTWKRLCDNVEYCPKRYDPEWASGKRVALETDSTPQ